MAELSLCHPTYPFQGCEDGGLCQLGGKGCPLWDPRALSPPASVEHLVGFAGAALRTCR